MLGRIAMGNIESKGSLRQRHRQKDLAEKTSVDSMAAFTNLQQFHTQVSIIKII